MTGYSDTLKAAAAMASNTSYNGQTLSANIHSSRCCKLTIKLNEGSFIQISTADRHLCNLLWISQMVRIWLRLSDEQRRYTTYMSFGDQRDGNTSHTICPISCTVLDNMQKEAHTAIVSTVPL